MKHLLLCLTLLIISCGCTTMRSVDDHVDFELASQTVIYRNQWVRKSALDVHIRPREHAINAPSVLFIPLRVTQPIDNPNDLAFAISRNIYQTWLTMQLFPAMEFTGDPTPYRRDRAVQMGRVRNADMVVGGFITYVYAGGTAGDTQIAIHLEAHDVQTGQLVWSMAQSGLMPASKTSDYLLFATKTRLPSDPLYAITRVISVEMGQELQNWLVPKENAPLTRDEKINRAIFSPRDPQPQPRVNSGQEDEQKSF